MEPGVVGLIAMSNITNGNFHKNINRGLSICINK